MGYRCHLQRKKPVALGLHSERQDVLTYILSLGTVCGDSVNEFVTFLEAWSVNAKCREL